LLSIGVGGAVPLSFTVFCEWSGKDNRGGYLTLLEAFWSMGAVIACLLAWWILPNYSWELFVVLVAAPMFFMAIWAYWIVPETPRYLLVDGAVDKAEEAVALIARSNGKPEFEKVKLLPSEATFEESSFRQMFSPQLRFSTLTLFILYFLLAYGCGIFVWMPVLLQEKKLEVMSMYRSMVIMALSQVPGVMFSALMVETIGRKYAIGICFGMGAVFTAVFAVAESELVIVMMTILMEFFLAGANGALSAITVEMFPTTLRSTAMGACSSLSRLSSVLSPTLWAALLDIGDRYAIFAGAAALALALVVIWMLPETKDADVKDHVKSD